MQHLCTEQGSTAKWVAKEYIFKMKNVGKQQGSQTAGCYDHCDEHKAKQDFREFFFLA